MADTKVADGQAQAESTGTTAAATTGDAGTSVGSGQTTGNGTDAGAESFFDPKSIEHSPELTAAYRQMQSAWTKKMTGVKAHQQKIDAYDSFTKSPLDTMRQLATQYGYNLVQRDEKATGEDFNPQTWDDVMTRAKKEVLREMRPVFDEVKSLKKQNIESYLDSHHADWRVHEDAMMETLQAHPSLVKDPDKLYRVSVPMEVWEARAMKAAQQKLKGTTDHAQVSGGSSTTKQTAQTPSGPLSFDQAVEVARQKVSAQGLKRPAG